MPYAYKHGDRPLDGLTVQRAVGRGGFGEVYYAVTDAGKEVALKYLRENCEIELRGVTEVLNLKSPHLVTIYDVRRNAAGEPFVIMEYVSGPSLRDLLAAEPQGLGVGKAVYLVQGIAVGLGHLHARGIVHRDLKPANIFVDGGYVKIGDYGLAKHLTASQHSGQTISIGTVHYMAPEIGSGNYTKLVDIYALGVLLYEMLTGRVPFRGASLAEVLIRQLRDLPDLTHIPAGLGPLLARALEKDPAARFQSALEFSAALTSVGAAQTALAALDPLSLTQVPHAPPLADDARHPPRILTPALDARGFEGARTGPAAAGQEERADPQHGPVWPAGARARHEVPAPAAQSLVWLTVPVVALAGVALFARWFGPQRTLDNPVLLLAAAAALPFRLLLLHHWWSCLPLAARRTDPLQAAVFSVIPFFNLYWNFVAYYGLALDLQRYAQGTGAAVRRAPARAGLAWCLLAGVTLLAPVLGLERVSGTASAGCWIFFAIRTTQVCRDVIRWRSGPRVARVGAAAVRSLGA